MAKQGVFNKLTDNYYAGIVTILSYRTVLAEYLPSLKLDIRSKPVLIDTALKGGSDFERFIECKVNDDGHIEYMTAFLTNPTDDLKIKADFLLSLYELPVKNSPLSRKEKIKILNSSSITVTL